MNDKVSEREFEAVIYRIDGKLDDLGEKFDDLIVNQSNLIDSINNSVNNQISLEKDQHHLEEQQEETNSVVVELVKNYKPSWESYKKVQKNVSLVSIAAAVTLVGLITGSIYALLTDKPPEPKPETKKVKMVEK